MKRSEPPSITVFTPTYQRADTLPRAYESLRAQTCLDFEWLIVDDGSTDGTGELVRGWIAEDPPFSIRYLYQENSGKHVADNRAAIEARAELIATLDSDDRYLPTTIASFLEIWRAIPPGERDSFSGAVALCALEDGTIVGDPFPEDVLDATYAELVTVHRVGGDKVGFGRVDVVRRHPYPVFEGERLVAEAIQSAQIGRAYRLRCVNQVLKVNDYREGGLTERMSELLQDNPRTAMALEGELLIDETSRAQKLKRHAKLFRYALHARRPLDVFRLSTSRTLAVLGMPAGAALYARDRASRRR